ncbi:MAG: transcription antitermination factor NusB [Dehalococcoidia bacterium]|nr:transcription antitermination factor NusB [Dehalococcoidia bacterium]
MSNGRRKLRRLVLQALFEGDCVKHKPENVIKRLCDKESLSEDTASFAIELVRGVMHKQNEIDSIIRKSAPSWPLNQIPIVDRNILRLAIFETLLNNDSVPAKVAINEAVELAKKFGSDNSAKFVNGVMGVIYNQIITEGDKK